MWLCDTLYKTMYQYLCRNSMSLTLYYDKLCFQKMMRMDYGRIEVPENQKLIKNVWNVLRNEYAIRISYAYLCLEEVTLDAEKTKASMFLSWLSEAYGRRFCEEHEKLENKRYKKYGVILLPSAVIGGIQIRRNIHNGIFRLVAKV